MSESDGDPKREKRPSAHATFEAITEIGRKLTELSTKFDFVSQRLHEHAEKDTDLEVRVRALELANSKTAAETARGQDTWHFVWSALISVGMLALGIFNYLK